MFRRLLVPLDGSRLAESVLPVVQRLGQLVPCSITLLHVIEKSPPTTIHGDRHLHDVPQAEAYLGGLSERLRAFGLRVDCHVHTVPQGDVPRCIADHALELDRDLIVLCTHGSSGLRRLVFGSNAEQVLSHGATPVLLLRPDSHGNAPSLGPERILVLRDRSTRHALEIGAELADLARARLYLLSVVPTLASMRSEEAAKGRLAPRATAHVLDLSAEAEAASLKEEVKALVARHIAATGLIERGDTASAVIGAADARRADLVVMAARGLAGLSAIWASAVTRRVAADFAGALLLLPREHNE